MWVGWGVRIKTREGSFLAGIHCHPDARELQKIPFDEYGSAFPTMTFRTRADAREVARRISEPKRADGFVWRASAVPVMVVIQEEADALRRG